MFGGSTMIKHTSAPFTKRPLPGLGSAADFAFPTRVQSPTMLGSSFSAETASDDSDAAESITESMRRRCISPFGPQALKLLTMDAASESVSRSVVGSEMSPAVEEAAEEAAALIALYLPRRCGGRVTSLILLPTTDEVSEAAAELPVLPSRCGGMLDRAEKVSSTRESNSPMEVEPAALAYDSSSPREENAVTGACIIGVSDVNKREK